MSLLIPKWAAISSADSHLSSIQRVTRPSQAVISQSYTISAALTDFGPVRRMMYAEHSGAIGLWSEVSSDFDLAAHMGSDRSRETPIHASSVKSAFPDRRVGQLIRETASGSSILGDLTRPSAAMAPD